MENKMIIQATLMKKIIVKVRNGIIGFIYKSVLKKIFFRMDPEIIHDKMIFVGGALGRYRLTKKIASLFFSCADNKLRQTILNIVFVNPIGLAAGFDKNAQMTDILPSIGFGFVEVGSITGNPCSGNPKPRLWRLIKSRGLVVHYGLKNDGCEKIYYRLKDKKLEIPIGINIAATNSLEIAEVAVGIADYMKSLNKLINIGNYFTINISCPNACGGQSFTAPEALESLLEQVDKLPITKPIFLKLTPDLSKQQIDEILEISKKYRIDGFICSNLTKNRENSKIVDSVVPKQGGMSGKIVGELSNELIRYVYNKTKGKYIIIGCGGVFSAEDAYQKIKLGASLVQLVTGIIFEGPQMISEIKQGLVDLLNKDGFDNISQAIGADNRQ